FRIAVFGFRLRHILRDIDQDRTRPSGLGQIERLFHRHGELRYVFDEEVVLHTGPRDPDRVAFLERVLADGVGRDLAGDDHHRYRVHVRRRDAGDGVRDARPGGDQAHADPVRRARITVGSVCRALFMPDQDVLDLFLLEQLVVDVENRTARIAED